MGQPKIAFLTLALLTFAAAPSAVAQSLKPECRIAAQPGAPVRITEYRCAYLDGVASLSENRISHRVSFESASAEKVVAVEFGFLSFDVWNEFLGHAGGLAMDDLAPKQHNDGSWAAHTGAEPSFHTGVAYVRKVRLASGVIWTADMAAILGELKKIQPDFDEAHLSKPDPAFEEK